MVGIAVKPGAGQRFLHDRMACGLAAHRPRDARCDIAAHRQVRKQQVVLEENSQVPLLGRQRSEEHTSELQSLMRNSYAVFCLKKKKTSNKKTDRGDR